jgi:cysteine desulfurase/selenocysteine lyase
MSNSFRSFFPIFQNNPNLTFLDSAASAQKPSYVIDGIKNFLERDYANIHRGAYELSERSEDLYHAAKEITKKHLNAESISEINFTYNATYAFNLLSASMRDSGWLQK